MKRIIKSALLMLILISFFGCSQAKLEVVNNYWYAVDIYLQSESGAGDDPAGFIGTVNANSSKTFDVDPGFYLINAYRSTDGEYIGGEFHTLEAAGCMQLTYTFQIL